MTKLLIGYVGFGMSGRSTSVAAVMGACNSPVKTPIADGWTEREIRLSNELTINVRVSVKRGRLYYAPGEAPESVREEIDWLCRADGIIFVIDSQAALAEMNAAQLERLRSDLAARGQDLNDKPIVFQVNKRDLPGALGLDEIAVKYKTNRSRFVSSIATRSIGTVEAVHALIELIGDRSTLKAER
jgi:hypothetical protein